MSAPDFAGVLAAHAEFHVKRHEGDPWAFDGTYVCECDAEFKAERGMGGAFRGHRAHVAAALHAELVAWLGSEAAVEAVLRALDPDGYGWAAGDGPGIEATLAALAQAGGGEGE